MLTLREALMDPTAKTPDSLEAVRQRRAELQQALQVLERALAGSTADIAGWDARVSSALAGLSADFQVHLEVTEGPNGLHHDVMIAAPRLAHAISVLTAEHQVITSMIVDLTGRAQLTAAQGVEAVHRDATTLIAHIASHRQRGADLMFEAFEADVGGQD
jgi:hypothetical protein